MAKKIVNYLELIRLPGMFTAHADILAAAMIAGALFSSGFLFLILATSCFFSAGMVLNDYFDYDIDSMERPHRPLPSGRISRKTAGYFGLILIIIGLFFSFYAGPRPFAAAVALVCAIFLYDGLLKDLPIIGPLAMASCRYFNFLMGLSLAPFQGWALVPLITGIYIFGVTVLSQKEVEGGKAALNISICALSVGGAALWIYFLFSNQVMPNPAVVLPAIVFAVFMAKKVLGLLTENQPADFQQVMKVLLLNIILLDAVIAWGFTPVYTSALILLLFIPARMSVRLFKVT